MDFVAQIIGLIASIIMIGAIQVKEKKNLYLILNILVKILYGINFALLSAYSGTITQVIGLVITVVAYIYEEKFRDSKMADYDFYYGNHNCRYLYL